MLSAIMVLPNPVTGAVKEQNPEMVAYLQVKGQ